MSTTSYQSQSLFSYLADEATRLRKQMDENKKKEEAIKHEQQLQKELQLRQSHESHGFW